MEDGARTLNAAQPAAEVRELVSANALYQQVVEMIVLVRPPIIIVIQIHVPSQEQPLHRRLGRPSTPRYRPQGCCRRCGRPSSISWPGSALLPALLPALGSGAE